MYSLAQAAKAAGKSKPTIARAIKAGKLSATRGEDGSYTIDPSELARVYPLAAAQCPRLALVGGDGCRRKLQLEKGRLMRSSG
jgi:hypothetical protein